MAKCSTEVREQPQAPHYVLRLYVAGSTPRSLRAIDNIGRICKAHLAGRYDLQVIDIYQQPERLAADQVVAAPTLIRQSPAPLRRMVGDLSNETRVLAGLDLGMAPVGNASN